jgi:predicted TIM-barrel fold metal-dependent hydrolase
LDLRKKLPLIIKLVSLKVAEKEWQKNKTQHSSVVRELLFDKYLDVAAEADVPVTVHTGYGGDFRELDPKHLLPFARGRQDVRFDLFHLGMPMIRDAIMIAKNLPNVTLNPM